MKIRQLFIALASIFVAQAAYAQAFKTIDSPNGEVKVTLFSNYWGIPGYSVTQKGDTLVNESQLGLKFSGSEVTGHMIDKTNYRWSQTDTLFNNAQYNEIIVTYKQEYKGTLRVFARAYNNGFAIKQAYVVDNTEKVFLQDEYTSFTLPAGSQFEQAGNTLPIDSLTKAPMPTTIKLAGGKTVTISKTENSTYPTQFIEPLGIPNVLKVGLEPMYEGNNTIKVVLPSTFETPYVRVVVTE